MGNVIRFPVERLRPREHWFNDPNAKVLCEAGLLRMCSSMDDLPDVDWSSEFALKRAALVGVAQ